jgi:hypothetical protein
MLPAGKHTKKYGKSQFLMGKSTINGHFQIALLNYQRVLYQFYSVFLIAAGKHKIS